MLISKQTNQLLYSWAWDPMSRRVFILDHWQIVYGTALDLGTGAILSKHKDGDGLSIYQRHHRHQLSHIITVVTTTAAAIRAQRHCR
jgi:hypothetical protein